MVHRENAAETDSILETCYQIEHEVEHCLLNLLLTFVKSPSFSLSVSTFRQTYTYVI